MIMDLADATLVIAAEKTGLKQILTLDSDFLFYRIRDRHSFDVIFSDDKQETHQPIWELEQELMQNAPPEELAKLPADSARNHDRYLYGALKQP